MMESTTPNTDHDLLIQVNENVKNLTSTLHQYTTSASQLQNDHELRLRTLETSNTTIIAELKTTKENNKRNLTIISTVGGVISVTLAVIMFLMK